MIAEISAIVAGVNMATSAIKQAAGTADDLSTIGVFLGKLGGAEVELAKAQNQGGLSDSFLQMLVQQSMKYFKQCSLE